jgi:ABC-type polysaccharide/polyol phosphate transport system ATPase subunit
VGDLELKKKCLQRIDEFKRQGGSILFVSHDMRSVRQTAERTLWRKKGQIVMEGSTDEVISAYEAD